MKRIVKRSMSILLLVALLVQLIPMSAPKAQAASKYTDADWEALIQNYQDSLFGDETVDWSDAEIQKIVGVKNSSGYSTSGLSYEAGRYWVSLEANRSNPDRIFWSTDITLQVPSDTMRRQFIGLFYMARAYGTKGTSYTYKDHSGNKVTLELYQNPDLYDAIFYGLEKGLNYFNYDRWIGYLNSPNKGSLYNWWDFSYGTPLEVLRVLLMMYPYATEKQASIAKAYADNSLIFMDKMRPNNDGKNDTITLGNRRTRLNIGVMIAAINRDVELMEETRTNLADFMTEHYDWEEGVRPDGSYICHSYWPMEGIYGVGVIVERIIDTYSNMAGTAFALDTADILADWMVDVFRPAMQNGLIMVPFMGRYPENGINAGKQALRGSLMLIDCFDAEANLKLKQFIREMVVQETEAKTAKAYSNAVQALGDVNLAAKLKDIVMDNTVSTADAEYASMRYCTDRAVQHQEEYTVALSMSSTRIAIPESINGQNRFGWFGGDGALYVYNDTTDYNTDQYDATYLRFANMYRLAGTTEEDSQLRQPWSNRNAYFPGMTFSFDTSTKSPVWTQEKNKDGMDAATFVGGVELGGKYIAAAMDFEAYSWTDAEAKEEVKWIDSTSQPDETVEANKMKQVLVSDLTAKKSYFMFDDEIVCVGSDIDFSTRNNAVNTYVDNRMLTETLSADGTMVYGTEDILVDGTLLEKTTTFSAKEFTDPTWVHMETFGGYYFPTGGTVYVNKPFRQSTNDGNNTNDDFNAYNVHVTPTTAAYSFFELYMGHGVKPTDGSYSYVMLPEKDATETEAYTKNPDIKILRNTATQHVVQETSLGITAMVFWKAGTYGQITVNRPMIVMVQEKDGKYILSASDPTQKLTSGTITINRSLSATALDSEIKVSGSNQTIVTIDFSKYPGKTVTAEFSTKSEKALMFDFGDGDRYMNSTYGYLDYSSADRWATGYLDNQKVTISGGFMTLPLTNRKDASGQITEWRTNIEPSDSTTNYAWSADTTKANFLNFDPTDVEIFQIRLKLDNVVAYGDYSPGIYLNYLVDGSSGWSNSLKTTDANYELLKLGVDQACMDGGSLEGKYVTLTLSLEKAKLRNFDKIKGIMVQFGYMHGGTATIDYIYIGPKTDSLYFGFENSGDTNRYYEGAYGGHAYDAQTSPAWGSACTDQVANTISVDNTEGTLTVYTACDYYGAADYGAYISTSASSGNYPWSGNTNRHSLSFDPSEAEIFEIRFKTEDIVAPNGKIPTLYLLNHLETAGVTKSGSAPTAQFELKNGEYQTVRIQLTDEIKSADYLKMLGVRFFNTKSASVGSVGKFVIDYMYVGKAINAPSNLYFDFDNSSAAQDRYGMESYGNLSYDTGSWSYSSGRLSAPVYSAADGTVSYTMRKDAEGALYLQTGTSLHANLPLNYVPENADYVQVRFKLENFTAYGNPTFSALYYTGQNSSYNGTDTLQHVVRSTYSLPADALTGGDYLTVTLPVKDAFKASEQITAIRLNFGNIKSLSNEQLGKITVDYVFIGRQEDLPVQNELFFDFCNTAADQTRYSNPIYSGHNFDQATNAHWALYNAPSATDFTIDNAAGTLNINVGPKTAAYAGPYLETTAEYGKFTWRTEKYFSLKYIPANAEYLQLRFKVENCVVTEGREPTIYVLYVGEYDGTIQRIQTINQTFTLANGLYQVVTIPLDDTFRSADLIRSFGVCFQNLSSDASGTIAVDYLYVGEKSRLPIQNDPLFFDFTNMDEDWVRYESKVYGYANFDAGNWSYSSRTTAPTFDWEEGTMSLEMKQDAPQSVIYVQSSRKLTDQLNLAYVPEGAQYAQVRFKLENFRAYSTPVMGLYFYQHPTSGVNGADHIGGACTTTYTIEEAHLTDGQYMTVTLPLSNKFLNSSNISAIRLNFNGIESLENDHLGKITVDYLYFGTEAELPREDYLLFDFKNSATDQQRYRQRQYNGFNFDLSSYWALYCAASATDFNVNNSAGTLTLNVPPKTTSITGPYLETTASYGNYTWRTEDYFTLDYEPDGAEYLQIRFKTDGCVADSGKTPQIYVLYVGEFEGTIQRIQTICKNHPLIDGAYQVVTIPLDDTFRSAETIRSLGVRFTNIYSDNGGTVTVDYLYVGPKSKLPTTVYTVKFVDSTGKVLQETLINSGETAAYTGATPTKAYDSANHYTFKGWDKAVTNITANTTFTAQFTATAHSYTYAKVDGTNHKGTCSCGYTVTATHGWNSGAVTTQPTCTATGVKTYTCTTCKATKTDTIAATGHTEVVDKAVSATCTTAGKTEGSHCSVCNAVIKAQTTIPATGHSYTYKVTKNPTTSATGTLTGTCSKCSGTTTVTLPKLNTTDYTKTLTKAPTCTATGVDTYKWNTTTYGSFSFTATTAALGHSYTAKVTAPTCTAQGYTTHTCSRCSNSYRDTYTNATGHSYTSKVTTAATCTKAGVKTFTCSKCNHSYTEAIAAKGHTEVVDKAVAATCTKDGKTEGSHCSVCNAVIKAQTSVPATGHSYNSKVTTAATCTNAGVKTFTCSKCRHSYTEAIAATGHTEVVDNAVAATCTTAGKTEGSHCSVCNAVIKAQTTIPATGHSYNSKVTTAATCTNAGVKTFTCSKCSHSYAEAIAATGHTEVIDKAVAATCTTAGKTEGSHCSVCNAVIKAQTTVPATGHSYSYKSNGDGTHIATCGRCNDSYTENHNFGNGACACGDAEITLDESIKILHTLDLASDISVTFAVQKTALANYDSYYLECVLPEYSGNELIGTSTVEVQPVVSGNYYYFTLTGITAVRMGDMVEAVLHMTKGGQEYISKTDSYSVATYAYGMLNSSKDAKMLTLCADLLRYGAEAQSFKGYRTDALVDADMTEIHRSYLSNTETLSFTATDSYLGDLASPTITWVGKTLDLGSKVGMKFVFNAKNYSGDLSKLTMKVTYQGSTGETKTVTLTGAEAYNANNKQYSFTFYGLLASELRTIVDVAIYNGNTQLSETLRYSAESYAAKTANTALESLTRALFAYSDSAKSYFTK